MARGYDAVMGIPAEDGLSLTLSRACHELVISWAADKPWEFIGGGHFLAQVDTPETTTSTSYAALATAGPSLVIARAGDYDVTTAAMVSNNTNGGRSRMSYDIGGTGAVDADAIWTAQSGGVSGGEGSVSRLRRKTAIAAATTLTAKYKTGVAGTLTASNRVLSVVPVRPSSPYGSSNSE